MRLTSSVCKKQVCKKSNTFDRKEGDVSVKMNLPNKLTLLRVFMIPFFVGVMLYSLSCLPAYYVNGDGRFMHLRIAACVIFCLASFTDFLDGHIARKYHLVTNFGKFMDPLADKLLVCSALILLTAEGSLPALVTLIIVAREFIISGFRLVASDNGVVIAASYWGKWKTVTQMALCILLILFPLWQNQPIQPLIYILMLLAVALTLISLIDYIAKNLKVITEGGM